MNANKFGFESSQNIASSYPINIDNINDIFSLSLPEKLPNITREDIISSNDKNVIDDNFIYILLMQLNNLLRQVPKYQMPPLFNTQSIHFKNKFLNAFTENVINTSPFRYEQQQQPLLQQQEQPPPQRKQQQQQQQQKSQ